MAEIYIFSHVYNDQIYRTDTIIFFQIANESMKKPSSKVASFSKNVETGLATEMAQKV